MQKMNLLDTLPVDPSNLEIRLVEAVGLKAMIRDDQVSIAMTTMKAGTAAQRHFHRFSKEIYIILNGSGELTVDKHCVPVTRGDVVLIKPGERHALLTEGEAIEFLAITLPAYSADDFTSI